MPGNTFKPPGRRLRVLAASMRPQRNAGEYGIARKQDRGRRAASMRPQRNAGEYFRKHKSQFPRALLQ